MLVKYKTILYGDKPAYKDFIRKKDIFKPNEVAEYKAISHDFCCEEMEHCIRGGSPLSFSDYNIPELYYNVYIPDKYGDGDNLEVKYCPFCGEKIKYEEVERSRYKKIKSFDYVEEEIKEVK